MTNDTSASIVSKGWNYAPSLSELWRTGSHVLKNAGGGYGLPVRQTGDTIEVRAARAFTYLQFDSDQRSSGFAQTCGLPLSASLRLKLATLPLKLRRKRAKMTGLDLA